MLFVIYTPNNLVDTDIIAIIDAGIECTETNKTRRELGGYEVKELNTYDVKSVIDELRDQADQLEEMFSFY